MNAWGPDCFWYWLHEHYPPNIIWCEERLCSLVVTPFNAWTNLGYIFGSFYVAYKLKGHSNKLFRFFSQAMFWLGLSSLIYHSSLNFFTQIFDFFGMYMFCFLLIMFNFDRVGKWPQGKAGLRHFWMWVVVATAVTTGSLMLYMHFPIQLYIFFLVLVIIWSELRAAAPASSPKRFWFWMSATSMTVAISFSGLDATRTMCDPQNHFWQGHGVWHLFGAIGLLCSFKHFAMIYGLPGAEASGPRDIHS